MLRVILLSLLAAGLGAVDALAQTLESDPPEAYVRVEGPITASGKARLLMSTLPEGEYLLLGRGPGLAASRGRFEVDGRGLTGQEWAGPEAFLFPPGFIHLERNESRGWYHLGTSALSGALWGLSFSEVNDAKDRLAAAETTRDALTDSRERSLAEIEVTEAMAEKTDKENIKELWGIFFVTSWLGAGLESALLTPEPSIVSTSQGSRVIFPRADRWSAAGRSALVPGAGQRYLGHSTRGTVFSTLVAASAVGAILAQDSYLEARRKENSAERRLAMAETAASRKRLQSDLEDVTSDRDTKSLVRWILTGTAAYFYVWNVVDALRLGAQVEEGRPDPRLSLAPTADGVALTLGWRFH